jgi:hypothetical protein
VSHTTAVLQCLSIWSYFWQLKHCRKMQFLMNRSHFFILKAFSNSSNNNRFVIFTMTISIWRIEYFFFFVWFSAIKSSSWWFNSSVNAHCFFANTLWNSSDYFHRCVQILFR